MTNDSNFLKKNTSSIHQRSSVVVFACYNVFLYQKENYQREQREEQLIKLLTLHSPDQRTLIGQEPRIADCMLIIICLLFYLLSLWLTQILFWSTLLLTIWSSASYTFLYKRKYFFVIFNIWKCFRSHFKVVLKKFL